MTDEELISGLEQATLVNSDFHHSDHVRAAFLYLTLYSPLEAMQRFSASLAKFAAACGRADRYNETITWAFLLLVRERMARAARPMTWSEFAAENPDLLDWKQNILKRYYRSETLGSELARRTFVFPDLCDSSSQ
jgi:hypothetical protein